MASVEPGDISSSDDSDAGHNGLSSSRNSSGFPPWGASHQPNLTGYNGSSHKDPSSSKTVSLQPSASNLNRNLKENAVEIDENILLNFGSSNSGRSIGSDGARLSSLTLMPSIPGKHSSATPFGGLFDSSHQTGIGEERPTGTDESYVYQAAVQNLHQPAVEASFPDGILSVSLLRHQKIALAWMFRKESSGLCLGGILADDQGLGKTVSMIALIQMQKKLEKSKGKESTMIPQATDAIEGFHSWRPTAGTLIVCPASVVRQWARELDEKVANKHKLSVLIYHGGNRTKEPAVLAKYDAVITTYAVVANEVPKQPLVEEDDDELKDGVSSAFSADNKRKKSSINKKVKKGKKDINMTDLDNHSGTLSRVKWSRVVLDESQTIKNHRTQVARACSSLRAIRRWCLSGTPIQNSIDELFSYFRFLRYDPYDKYKTFVSSIKAFIARDPVKGYQKLQVILGTIMLRRTKGTLIGGRPIINLPPKRVELTRVEFSSEERAFYEKLEFDSRKQFKAYGAAGTVIQNYANILLMLMRLRQACDHPFADPDLLGEQDQGQEHELPPHQQEVLKMLEEEGEKDDNEPKKKKRKLMKGGKLVRATNPLKLA